MTTHLICITFDFDAGHEIGHHGWTPMPPNELSRETQEEGRFEATSRFEN